MTIERRRRHADRVEQVANSLDQRLVVRRQDAHDDVRVTVDVPCFYYLLINHY